MTRLRTLCIFAILAAVACAQDSTISTGRPDLRGLWHIFDPRRPQAVIADLIISQSGNEVAVRWLPIGKQEILMYEGTFESDTVIAGRELDTTAPQENRWTPVQTFVTDLNHLQLDPHMILRRAPAKEAAAFTVLRRMSMEKLPVTPVDLNGTWSFESGQQIFVTQHGADIEMRTEKEGQTFRGRYMSNPLIPGEGLHREATGNGLRAGEMTITVLDPDRLQSLGHPIYRISNPPAHDIPCDVRNPYHVRDYFAKLRGAAAYEAKDYKEARCWFTIGADWGYAPAQSLLADLIIDGKDGAAPDYALAFDLASKSAAEGDEGGEFALAALYESGKGTPRDPEKAKFWADKAKLSQGFSQVMSMITPEKLAGGIGIVSGMLGSMVDFNLGMTPPSCFSRDVLGNRSASCK